MTTTKYILGIDGGGSKTSAWLASLENLDEPLGKGQGGPSNPQSVGWDVTLQNLNQSIDAAFADAGIEAKTVSAACIALAGGDRENVRQRLQDWATHRSLASQFLATHDALPLLAAGTPEGVGIAIVSGTGSFAFGRSSDGAILRSGGWGYLFGDEGSGYSIAITGLRAAARAFDGRGEKTQLCDLFIQQLQVTTTEELIPTIYARAHERRWLASLAEPVFRAAEQKDPVASEIMEDAASELAQLTASVANGLQFEENRFPLALSGGVLIHSDQLRKLFVNQLHESDIQPEPLAVVTEPVAGAVICASELLD